MLQTTGKVVKALVPQFGRIVYNGQGMRLDPFLPRQWLHVSLRLCQTRLGEQVSKLPRTILKPRRTLVFGVYQKNKIVPLTKGLSLNNDPWYNEAPQGKPCGIFLIFTLHLYCKTAQAALPHVASGSFRDYDPVS